MNTNTIPAILEPNPSLVMAGNCGYQINGNKVTLTIAEIANNRDNGCISGTLAVELWANTLPYQGGDVNGQILASTCIGELYDQHFLADCRYELDFLQPTEGTWLISLLLREWTDMGYITRDHVNFSVPYVVAKQPVIARQEESNIINISFPEHKKTSAKPGAKKTDVASQAAIAEKTADNSHDKLLSINEASVKEIAAIKGVSRKLAENISAERPFGSFDALLKVKGMGPKMLEKIRNFIKL